MRRSVLEHLLRRRPFRPFQLTLSNDELFDIRHPEAAFLAKRFVAVALPPTNAEASDAEEMVWIDYRHIVHCRPVVNREIPF